MATVRVLIVDDSALVRALIRALIEMTADLTVCGEAKNGRQAVEQTLALCPDIITMDLQMPEMGGLEAIENIMATRPTPILVLSDVADAQQAMAAVARGALESTHKPSADNGRDFTDRLKMLAGVPVIRHIRRKSLQVPSTPVPTLAPPVLGLRRPSSLRPERVFAIAASTGGPQALAQILPKLPVNFPAPILIAQHISDGFAAGMATWLNDLCALTVMVAQEGEPLLAGRVYLADSTAHLTLTPERCIHLKPRLDSDLYRPNCNVTLMAAAQFFGRRAIGIILSGMGRDGAEGIAAIQRAGGVTLGQDEATSVVYGMNREAIMAGSVQSVLPVTALAEEMTWLARAPVLERRLREPR